METLTVQFKQIKKQYGAKEVLSIEALSAYHGRTNRIIGRNGEGKSTLLKLITGEIQPDSGTIQTTTTFNYLPKLEGSRILTIFHPLTGNHEPLFRYQNIQWIAGSGGEAAKSHDWFEHYRTMKWVFCWMNLPPIWIRKVFHCLLRS